MRSISRALAQAALFAISGVTGLAALAGPQLGGAQAAEEPAHPAALDDAIIAAAKRHGVPEHLVRRIIMRESKYNPKARNHSFWGLMQISYPTAKSMGFKGTREELLNPVVNLRYAVPYLANAFVIAGKQEDAAVRLYAAGYYFTARSKGLLPLLRTADSLPLSGLPDQPILAANAAAQPPQSFGIFGALFGPGETPSAQPATQLAAAIPDTAPPMSKQVASASQQGPRQAQHDLGQAAQSNATPPAGTFDGASVSMVTTKTGDVTPPKKWVRDGGMTLIARGEQGLDQVADRTSTPDDAASRKSTHRHAQKITTFADLGLPPSSAQAYAGATGQDPRFAAADSQAAIAQATAGQQTSSAQADPASAAEPSATDRAKAGAATDATIDKPSKRSRSHQVKRHKPSLERTQQALADKPAEAPAQPAATQ